MRRALLPAIIAALMAPAVAAWGQGRTPDGAALYRDHCAACHGVTRLGEMGPALVPESLARLTPERAEKVIARGRVATRMPAFQDTLSAAEIAALSRYIFSPPATVPVWDIAKMRASHRLQTPRDRLPAKPIYHADPLNLFVVVEAGDHHATILDGDRFVPLARFATPRAVHGGTKFSPDGRFLYLVSRDGWVIEYDLYGLVPVAKIRAGINSRNIAVSADGRYVAVANSLPDSLVILDATDLTPVKVIPVVGDKGARSRLSAVYTAPPRHSFIAALKDLAEIWEIGYDAKAHPVYPGFVHSYETGHAEALGDRTGPFAVRRIRLQTPIEDFFFNQSYSLVIGASRALGGGQVINLNVGRKIADVALDGMPHLGSGISWKRNGHWVMATPNLRAAKVSVIDMESWKTIATIPTLGPGFFMRSHKATPYAWVDVFSGPNRDAIQVIDKRSLTIVRTLRPAPGKTSMHIEFTRDGAYALVSIWDMDGAIVVYDAKTLEEFKRLPMKKPVGKYNVFNKITYSAGTSH